MLCNISYETETRMKELGVPSDAEIFGNICSDFGVKYDTFDCDDNKIGELEAGLAIAG